MEEINKHPTQSSNHPNADVAAIYESKYPKIPLLPTISVVKKKVGEEKPKKATQNISEKGKPAAKNSKSKAPRRHGRRKAEGITHQYQSSRG